ncbi:MAG: exonuclease SbcCD subunit D [Clostridiales bacterium]|nr:exonuclease SbcCD subunit D [Clostridiales bacterium]
MRFFHLADLHLGKSLYGYSLIDEGDQPYWVDRLLEAADEYRPDAVVIAGDVYDRAVPPKEAVELLDRLLTALSQRNIPVLMVAGNHDSGPRLAFASGLLERERVYIAGECQKELTHVTLEDEYGPVTFWLMPYLFPAAVRFALDREDVTTYDRAVRALLDAQPVDTARRNVLVAHQFVVSGGAEPERDGSETAVGGVGQVDASAFSDFDYVALGHIHGPQKIGRETVRYGGSPLPYSFSEVGQRKGVTLVELGEKGQMAFRLIELPALHRMRQVKGTLEELLALGTEDVSLRNDYLRAVLTDVQMPPRAMERLRAVYPNLMEVARELPQAAQRAAGRTAQVKERPLEDLFWDFYTHQAGEVPDQAQTELAAFVAEQSRQGTLPELRRGDDVDQDTLALVDFALRRFGEEEQPCDPKN